MTLQRCRCGRTKPWPKETKPAARASTTGHEWDGIEELNTPLPRWWLFLFYATIIWSIGYWVVYPAWPTVTGFTAGVWGYLTVPRSASDLADLTNIRGEKGAALAETSLADIEKNPSLLAFAQAQGKAGSAITARHATAPGRRAPRAIPI